ncbi:MAG: glycosyltransferase [Hydrogenophaga sp.]|uniref:glycosyltransferase n=1 Tax=Hydrogenophaga sp. TaxID=1904254 RepID=UPI002605BF5C|nr:glycosyltransferase [Hydrogenophaga sp.]MDM7943808.1 glycosyltransferase [Hydrogenophaga sp.]
MKLLFLLPNIGGGGIERAMLNLLDGLTAGRYDPRVVVHERGGTLAEEVASRVDTRFLGQAPYSRWRLPMLFWHILGEVRRTDVVVAMNEGRAAVLGLLAAKLVGKPVVSVINFDWSRFKLENSWRQTFALRMYRFMDAVVAVSHGAAEGFCVVSGMDSATVRVISVPQPIARVRTRALEPLPEAFQATFEGPTVVAVGRLDRQKGLDVLIDAHARVLELGVQHRLILVGQGGLLNELRVRASELGVEGTVVFAGFQSNPFPFVRNSTVFAMSSRFEGQPLALAEAMTCGAAIVSTDCPAGPREMLDDGRCGLLVPVEDPAALAGAIASLLRDPKVREGLRTAALERSKMFDDARVVRDWEAVIDSVRR